MVSPQTAIQDAFDHKSKVLNLNGYTLDPFPEEIFRLKHLEQLYLADNKISHIPSGLGSLSSLREIYLNDNLLSALPSANGCQLIR
ncbi:MAG: leucine-rich repeat domain-containing protein [Saprospiraceae bacterium]